MIYRVKCSKYNCNTFITVSVIDVSTQDNPNSFVLGLLSKCSKVKEICQDCEYKDLCGKPVKVR